MLATRSMQETHPNIVIVGSMFRYGHATATHLWVFCKSHQEALEASSEVNRQRIRLVRTPDMIEMDAVRAKVPTVTWELRQPISVG